MTTPAIVPSPIDLTDLESVKAWLQIDLTNHSSDVDIQDVITGFSKWVLGYTGIASFNQVASYTENRDGNGSVRMFTRNRPIVSVQSVTVNGVAIPQSTSFPAFGWFISDDQKQIVLRSVGSALGFTYLPRLINLAPCFGRGVGNVQLVYTAGYTRVPFDVELAARKASAIYFIRRNNLDLGSKSVSAGGTTGTTRFRDWNVPPEICEVLDLYSRYAIV